MTTLKEYELESNAKARLQRIDLSSKIPPSDPGCWYSVYYGEFPAADLIVAKASDRIGVDQILDAADKGSLQFLLIDLDQHPWLAHEDGRLTQLVRSAEIEGLRVVPYCCEPLETISTFESRDAAIAFCLQKWELQLLKKFCW
ncbi:hypothetical protein [Gimesia maris]|uniref:Uncharacterized protein n=1 Tax=Gimesia maris TaxID=122 RepID=A0ABX5YRC9_9PLAN|nr:hypothetical protein [Gimesia maris]EDL59255.1 hypothetical protein PM8797T_23449 [Gimesia maris DSM 8797]QEG18208.1 hypothetical protein GmarT_40940 [Gimesia maris]QGQ28790.1 hypothetical protein F1729_09115 [Gimesia maris]